MTDSFPRQQARTQRFSLGAPRSFAVSRDGSRITFLRSKGGSDPVTCLWVLDVPDGPADPGTERLVADPASLAGSDNEASRFDEPEEEKARRERSREIAGGVVAYATDTACSVAAFALAGQVYVAGLAPGDDEPRPVGARQPAIDPRPDPTGSRVGYVCSGALRITDLGTGEDTELIGPDGDGVTFGLAEFVAAEEMGRRRGYWWAPDGSAVLVARVDESDVQCWHIADPANPDRPPKRVGYPAAGTPNAEVTLFIVRIDGTRIPVHWDREACSYLVTADWPEGGPLIVVQSRDQRLMRLLTVDTRTGETTVLREDSAPLWLDIVPGVPARTSDGLIIWTADAEGARRLLVAEPAALADHSAVPATPASLQVRGVLAVDGPTVVFSASGDEPTEINVWTCGPGGAARLSAGAAADPGAVHSATRAGGTTVLTSQSMAGTALTVQVLRNRPGQEEPTLITSIASLAERPMLPGVRVTLLRAGQRELRAALVLPSWHEPGAAKLPVLMDPYGGPHSQRVLANATMFLTSQWFAEQGFAVIVADGRGTPGRGPEWERAIAGNVAGPVLDDQVEALAAIASGHDDLDLAKVAIRGWSFGGYLAALAVLRRPDVFHAAVAGAPVTEWRLYDTHYTERYLGDPAANPSAYDQTSLIEQAHLLTRPLMIIHGLADDNVVVAHTLRLSSALLAAGRPHSVLPLSGVTHLAGQPEVAENLLLLQVDFLRRALGVAAEPAQASSPAIRG